MQAAAFGKIGQGIIDKARGKKSKKSKSIDCHVQGHIDVLRGKKSRCRKKVVDRQKGIFDALHGKKSPQSEKLLSDIKTSVKKTGYWIDENKEAIAMVAAIAVVGYAACVDGCTFLLGVGDASFKIGAYNSAAAAGAIAGGVSLNQKQVEEMKMQGTLSPSVVDPKANTDVDLENRLGQFRWSFGGYTYSSSDEVNSDYENLYDGAKEAFENFMEHGPRTAGALGALSILFTPSEIAHDQVPNWNIEKNARMDRLLVEVMRQKDLVSAADEKYLYTSLQNGRLTLTVAPLNEGPEFRAGREEPIVIVKPQTLVQQIDSKAQIIGIELGTTKEEVTRRIEAGMEKDNIQR